VFDDGVRQLVPPEHASGPALGVAESTIYGTVTAPVKGLRRMICFTQGLKEARNQDGVEFGVTRMLEEIERGGDMEKVMERLSETVREFCGGEVFRNAICLLGWEVTK